MGRVVKRLDIRSTEHLLLDSHCHLDFRDFSRDRAVMWQKCQSRGVRAAVIPSVVPRGLKGEWGARAERTSERGLERAVNTGLEPVETRVALNRLESYLEAHVKEVDPLFLSEPVHHYSEQNWYFTTGLHPWWVNSFCTYLAQQFDRPLLKLEHLLSQALSSSHYVGLGESGLDFSFTVDPTQRSLQRESLRVHLQLGSDHQLPVILHSVKAHADLIAELKQFPNVRGVIHAFAGSYDIAKEYLNLGFKLGVGGVITYSRSKKTRDAFRHIPLESLVLETDAPAMPISGRQGERNTPENLAAIACALATLKNCSYADVANATTTNSLALFGICDDLSKRI